MDNQYRPNNCNIKCGNSTELTVDSFKAYFWVWIVVQLICPILALWPAHRSLNLCSWLTCLMLPRRNDRLLNVLLLQHRFMFPRFSRVSLGVFTGWRNRNLQKDWYHEIHLLSSILMFLLKISYRNTTGKVLSLFHRNLNVPLHVLYKIINKI